MSLPQFNIMQFVAENEGAVGDEGGVVSVFVVVQVSTADTHTAGTQQHHAGVLLEHR